MNILQQGTHLDHLLRQTRMHHVQLSSMADVKANMMLTLASLVITFCIRYLTDPILRWPVFTLIGFCLVTIFAAAYAVMPKGPNQVRPDLKNPNCDILFFGNFIHLAFDEYAEVMEQVMSDPNRVYEAQVREIYELGVFLATKKYRFIRIAYIAFITGLVVSGFVFLVVEVVNTAV
ncbi:MAG: hypothetical protein DWQ04_12175 [Chloroflexi bacterium]|nr:MAG: hypothetical protein DWQ04_12175 [Chloroflexota bacterium]